MDPRLLAICSTYGVFLRREALDLGYNDPEIARLVRTRTWHRVRHGAYVYAKFWDAADNKERYHLFVRAALRQAKTPVVASHTSAVAFHEGPLWGLRLDLAHLTRRDGRTGRKEAGVQQHRGVIVEGDVVEFGSYVAMSATRAALEVSAIASIDAAVCVFDNFLHHKLTTREAIQDRYNGMGTWPGTLTTDVALGLADPRRQSVGESRTAMLCWREGLPAPVPQFEVYDENGILVGIVDFAWPEYGVFLEFDGRRKYLTQDYRRAGESIEDVILREKQREELICAITGWRCIRITWSDLERPGVLALRIRNLLERGAA